MMKMIRTRAMDEGKHRTSPSWTEEDGDCLPIIDDSNRKRKNKVMVTMALMMVSLL